MADQTPTIPFRKATLKKRTLMSTFAIPSGLGGQNDWELNSKGYLNGIKLLYSGTETTATADPVATADFPFSIANRIEIRDSAGGMVQSLKGYSAYLARRYFIPNQGHDIAQSGDVRIYRALIQVIQANNVNFSQELAIETGDRDSIGALPNQNASFKYTLTLTIEALANVVGTAANWASSALVVQPSMRYYTVPAAVRADGANQQVTPPFPGIIRQVFDQSVNVGQAAETPYPLTTGHVKRAMILVFRATSAGARQGSITRIKLMYGDDNVLFDATEQDLIDEHYKLYDEAPPTGVYVIPFDDDADGFVGADFRRDLLDTRRLSNLYFLITCSTTGALNIIHDDLLVPLSQSI